MKLTKKNISYTVISSLAIFAILLVVFVINLKVDKKELQLSLDETQSELASSTRKIALLESDLESVLNDRQLKEQLLSETQTDLIATQQNLRDEEAKIGLLTDQVSSISGVVGKIEKLNATDEELLQKYSKVFFLNEHYIPVDLALIEDGYVYNPEKRYWFHKDAYNHLKALIIAARLAGHDLSVISAYRSFYAQGDLKLSYTVTYGQGANTFSADQGYSEHQLGTTVDLTEESIGTGFEKFGDTDGYDWLRGNAHKFGFVLSYPEGNAYYTFEPWHWRFVGVELATKLKNEGKNFYDEEQRILNEYLISIFDPIGT